MNVGILYGSSQKNDGKMKAIAQGLSEGIQSQGHRVDLIDMNLEVGKIVSFYDYLVIGTNNTTFFGGKIPEVVPTFSKGREPSAASAAWRLSPAGEFER